MTNSTLKKFSLLVFALSLFSFQNLTIASEYASSSNSSSQSVQDNESYFEVSGGVVDYFVDSRHEMDFNTNLYQPAFQSAMQAYERRAAQDLLAGKHSVIIGYELDEDQNLTGDGISVYSMKIVVKCMYIN